MLQEEKRIREQYEGFKEILKNKKKGKESLGRFSKCSLEAILDCFEWVMMEGPYDPLNKGKSVKELMNIRNWNK